MWKTRIWEGVATGPVETIGQDDQGEFGQWLQEVGSVDQQSTHYKTAKALHSDFHRTAAKGVQLSITGHVDEARKMLELKGEFTAVSAKLTNCIMDWKKAG